ncbi:MAG TPA: hypothetical protein VKP88_02040 [Candidatus Paceibacterota bacterium]|nr:hypothetical protein [Candidatus Paceibacterota bacterium]
MKTLDMARFQVTLPEWYHRKLLLWATLKGTNRATLAMNIVQARIETNWPDIDKELNAIANHEGITREELETKWLRGDD